MGGGPKGFLAETVRDFTTDVAAGSVFLSHNATDRAWCTDAQDGWSTLIIAAPTGPLAWRFLSDSLSSLTEIDPRNFKCERGLQFRITARQ